MTDLEAQRDNGPVAARVPGSRLPVGELGLVTAALVVGVGGASWGSPSWAWVLVGVVLAVGGRMARPSRRLAWSVPGLLRALEYGAVLVLVAPSPWSFALLAAMAFHHYDIVYRARAQGAPPPRWLSQATGGWELRTAGLAVTAALGVPERAAAILAIGLASVFVTESVVAWTTHHRPAAGR